VAGMTYSVSIFMTESLLPSGPGVPVAGNLGEERNVSTE
jgi:hypothetical protein